MNEAASSKAVETDSGRKTIFIVVGVATLLLLLAVFYLASRPSQRSSGPPPLEGALRAGTPEFEQYRDRIVIDGYQDNSTESPRAMGDIIMELNGTARNFTGRTINGLEVRAAVVDLQGRPIQERIVNVIPTRQSELETNKTMPVQVRMEGFRKTDNRANIKMEVTAVRFKQ